MIFLIPAHWVNSGISFHNSVKFAGCTRWAFAKPHSSPLKKMVAKLVKVNSSKNSREETGIEQQSNIKLRNSKVLHSSGVFKFTIVIFSLV